MKFENAVDIYSNFLTGELVFFRRKDGAQFVFSDHSDVKEIGHIVTEAIFPNIPNELFWEPIDESWYIDHDIHDCVVVYREGGKTIVGTPLCEWGQAPKITFNNHPSFIDLGGSVLTQLQYTECKRKKNA